jgi:hypothetical protein
VAEVFTFMLPTALSKRQWFVLILLVADQTALFPLMLPLPLLPATCYLLPDKLGFYRQVFSSPGINRKQDIFLIP